MAIGDILQLTVDQLMHGQRVLNVFHYRVAVNNANNEDQLITAFQTVVQPVLRGFQSNEISIVGYLCQKIHPLPLTRALVKIVGPFPGLIPQEPLPTSCAAVVTKYTALAGRAKRGRSYICGIPEAHEVESRLASTGLDNLKLVAIVMAGSLAIDGGGEFEPVLWHRATRTFDDITDCVARPIIRNQRRRQLGVGQ